MTLILLSDVIWYCTMRCDVLAAANDRPQIPCKVHAAAVVLGPLTPYTVLWHAGGGSR